MSGLKLAVLYGFYPNQFGFCGPQKKSEKGALLNYLSGKRVSEQKIRKILKSFIGAFSYYKLIADSNKIKDPFDERVVKAYWLGNQLLEKVSVASLKKMVAKKFSKEKARKIPLNSKAHHSFHVFLIGSVTGRIVLEGKLLDICRIGWGKVIKVKSQKSKVPPSSFGLRRAGKSQVIIEYQPIQKKNKKYFLAKPIHKFVFWDKKFIPEIKIGDIVTIHWNHIIQILSKRDLANLQKYTQMTINSFPHFGEKPC